MSSHHALDTTNSAMDFLIIEYLSISPRHNTQLGLGNDIKN